jgi:hypothetical protein
MGGNMIEVNAAMEIAASPEAVWSVLTDLEHFKAWNPFIRDAAGTTEVGGTIRVRVRPSLGVGLGLRANLGLRAKVIARDDNRELRWRGHVGAPWLARGDHTFTIEPLDNGRVRFVQHETFAGVLPRLAGRLLARETQRGFDAMNHALEARVHELEGKQ